MYSGKRHGAVKKKCGNEQILENLVGGLNGGQIAVIYTVTMIYYNRSDLALGRK